MKVAIVIVLLLFLVMASQAQEPYKVLCDQGYCVMSQDDMKRLVNDISGLLHDMEKLIEENSRLKERTGCS